MRIRKQRERQIRAFRLDDVQVGDAGHVIFHSSIFGVRDSYGTYFDRGCFARTINANRGEFAVTWFHDPREAIGLGLHSEDASGLRVECDLDLDIEAGRRVYSGLQKRYIDCASISFDVMTEALEENETHFKEVRLFESALLTRLFSSNPAALVDEVRARTGVAYPAPPLPVVTEADLRETIEALAALRERELTDPERVLLTECSDALWALLVPEQGRPYPNEHACRLQAPSKFSEFRRGTRKHEGKTYSVIFGHVKDSEDWEEQAYRYAKDTWDAAEARAHCKSHDGSFEAASGQDAIACALSDIPIETPSPILLPPDFAHTRDELAAAALASRGPALTTPGGGPRLDSGPDLHPLLPDRRALEQATRRKPA